MCAGDALFEHRGIPGKVEVDDKRRGLQVEADAAGVGGEEDAASGVVEKFLDEVAAFCRGDSACEFDITKADALERGFGKGQHICPLAEDYGFVSVGGNFLAEDFLELGEFGARLLAVFGFDVFIMKRE